MFNNLRNQIGIIELRLGKLQTTFQTFDKQVTFIFSNLRLLGSNWSAQETAHSDWNRDTESKSGDQDYLVRREEVFEQQRDRVQQ